MIVSRLVRENPDFVGILPSCGLDARVKLDVLLELMPLNNMFDVSECFWLRRKFFFPVPFVQKLFVP
jgi:hypothetical protein